MASKFEPSEFFRFKQLCYPNLYNFMQKFLNQQGVDQFDFLSNKQEIDPNTILQCDTAMICNRWVPKSFIE